MSLQEEPYYSLSVDEVIDRLGASESGLDESQVSDRIAKYGLNELVLRPGKNRWEILLSQVRSPIVYLLGVASVISLFFGDIPEFLAIVGVLVINTIIGYVLEEQAIKSMDSLRNLAQSFARVKRNGNIKEIESKFVVPGDIVLLEAGDIVSADGRLLSAEAFEINESILTGESLPVEKSANVILEENASIADQVNMVYKGTSVTHGTGIFVVTATGMQTGLGSISSLVVSTKQEEVPLQKNLNSFSKRLIVLTVIVCAIFVTSGVIRGRELYPIIETAIALAVAAIPEGLPIVATIAMARGMLRLSRRNVIVKKLEAIETLGETNVIITDKTGTLTENQLAVNEVIPSRSSVEMARIAMLCSNSHETETGSFMGDPVEVALLMYYTSQDKDNFHTEQSTWQRLVEIPFDSEKRYMSILYKSDYYLTVMKGSPAAVMKACSEIPPPGNRSEDQSKPRTWDDLINEMASRGLKVLGFASRHSEERPSDLTEGLIFAGIIGLEDPPRADVPASVKDCQSAGIKIIMATGDHPATAAEIARRVGIVSCESQQKVFTGTMLAELPSQQWENELADVRIFSRVSPAQKIELVSFYQSLDNVVGMTGDGVNDAPALRKADIGIAMGARGTQVAKDVADIVLQDDAFTSIVSAIRYGRIIYDNIRYFIIYLISCNLSEILVVSTAAIWTNNLVLLPLQILFLNLVTDVFPALALGMGKGDPTIMNARYRDKNSPIINEKDWWAILVYSLFLTACVLGLYYFALFEKGYSQSMASTMAFFTLAFGQLFHPFNLIQGEANYLKNTIIRNPYIWGAILLCTVLLLLVAFTPIFNELLGLAMLGGKDWQWIILASLIPLPVTRIVKLIRIKIKNHDIKRQDH